MSTSTPPGRRRLPAITLFFLAVTGLFGWSALTLSGTSGLIPQLVLAFTSIMLAFQATREWLQYPDTRRNTQGAAFVFAVMWLSLLPLACWLLGIAAGSAVFTLCWLRWHARENWWFSCFAALLLGLVVHLLFGFLPGVAQYTGVFFQPFS